MFIGRCWILVYNHAEAGSIMRCPSLYCQCPWKGASSSLVFLSPSPSLCTSPTDKTMRITRLPNHLCYPPHTSNHWTARDTQTACATWSLRRSTRPWLLCWKVCRSTMLLLTIRYWTLDWTRGRAERRIIWCPGTVYLGQTRIFRRLIRVISMQCAQQFSRSNMY